MVALCLETLRLTGYEVVAPRGNLVSYTTVWSRNEWLSKEFGLVSLFRVSRPHVLNDAVKVHASQHPMDKTKTFDIWLMTT